MCVAPPKSKVLGKNFIIPRAYPVSPSALSRLLLPPTSIPSRPSGDRRQREVIVAAGCTTTISIVSVDHYHAWFLPAQSGIHVRWLYVAGLAWLWPPWPSVIIPPPLRSHCPVHGNSAPRYPLYSCPSTYRVHGEDSSSSISTLPSNVQSPMQT